MRNYFILVALIQFAACRGGSPTGSSIDAGVEPDAGAGPDAATDAGLGPCEGFGLPGPPSVNAERISGLRDVDGDGRLDLVVVNTRSVRVFLGTGTALSGSSIDSPMGTPEPFGVGLTTIVDVNGDGKLDLIVRESASQTSLHVLLGDGSGRFRSGIRTPEGRMRSLAAADFNADGKPDVVLIPEDEDTIKVRLGEGDGTFGEPTVYSVGQGPTALAVADLDGDGISDVIVATTIDGTVSVLQGNGDGTFNRGHSSATGFAPHEIATTDLNGDGKVDVLVYGTGISVHMNDGNGMLGEHVDYIAPLPAFPSAFAAGDVNHDGKPDVVAIDRGGQLFIFAGNGDGTLRPPAVTTVLEGSTGLALGDVSGDNALDIITSNFDSATVSVLESDRSGGFRSEVFYTIGSVRTSAAAAADFNGDGFADVALFGGNRSSLGIALGNSGGLFQDVVQYPMDSQFDVLVHDVNGDGIADVVAATWTGFSVLLGNGVGTFRDRVDSPGSGAPFAVGDFNGDARPDIVVAHGAIIALYTGNGDGTFSAAGELARVTDATDLDSLVLADMNGDGRLDIVEAHRQDCAECVGPDGLGVMLNAGDGTLHSSFASRVFNRVTAAVADVDGDGKLDVVTLDALTSGGGSIWRGNGDGTLQPAVNHAAAPGSVQIVDVTGDGKLDIFTSGRLGMSILPGKGDGTFLPALRYPNLVGQTALNSELDRVAIADINQDGLGDIITRAKPVDREVTFAVLFARCLR